VIDFKKRLAAKAVDDATDPIKLYDTLDRASDKGPLRPAQEAVLKEWFASRRDQRDVIVKLHTGQGKTLIGLLILQARLNEKHGPALYLCPDNYLIEQTCNQAKQFGITTCTADPDIPEDFLAGKRILVTSVQKLFNGLTKFGLRRRSMNVGTLLMDDAHACADTIREQCRIRLPTDDAAYPALLGLFAQDLEKQGVGTFADISNSKYDARLPVPYWAWVDRESDVARILSDGATRNPIKFAWPLLKDVLGHCQCVVSGGAIEIEPNVPPLEDFGSYWKAGHRVFMSATVTDDAFLVKGLRLSPESIEKPLTYDKERWSGEKMVLIPALISDSLTRSEVVRLLAKPHPGRKYGVVALAPSFAGTKDWQAYGARIANKDTISEAVQDLVESKYNETVVLVNRYDGVDLPDAACRILVFDSKPYSESLIDLYQEGCRSDSEAILVRTLRTVEQGFGRSVRGEKDYSVIVVTGPDLTRLIREPKNQRFLSSQMAAQIQIGREIAEMAQQEIAGGANPVSAFSGLVRQCVLRDAGWKAFYAERMEVVEHRGANRKLLDLYGKELGAELKYQAGDYVGAAENIQQLLDDGLVRDDDRAWYLQELARYHYADQRSESQRLQVAAFKKNRLLLRPPDGVTVARITVVSHGRVERIMSWVRQLGNYENLNVTVSDIIGRLVFGAKADNFEKALDELSCALGFVGERPDKEWKEGPDNLWALNDTDYLLWECKSEVDVERAEINKGEAEQMNRSCAWFGKHYGSMKSTNIIVIPTHNVASAAAFTHEVSAMRQHELGQLTKAVAAFYKTFGSMNIGDLSALHIQKLLDTHKLSVAALKAEYTKVLRHRK